MTKQGILVVVEVTKIHDPDSLAAYQGEARKQLAARGAILLGRGGAAFEGDPVAGTVLVQQWGSAQAFRDWQDSEEYRPLREQRRKAADIRILIVDAV